jgi:hypothetical protein
MGIWYAASLGLVVLSRLLIRAKAAQVLAVQTVDGSRLGRPGCVRIQDLPIHRGLGPLTR